MYLNPDQDLDALGEEFLRRRRVLVRDALHPSAAEALRTSIQDIDKGNLWYQAQRGNRHFFNPLNLSDKSHFSYRFDKFPVANVSLTDLIGAAAGDSRRDTFRNAMAVGLFPERELPEGHPVRAFGILLNGKDCVAMVSRISGFELPENGTNCVLSRYMPGDYLSAHDDGLIENGGRRVAFVYSLTQSWLPHWGGQTLFFDDPDGVSSEAYMPRFNSLLLFAVPVLHAVTAVASTCAQVRYAMSGWFHAAPFDR